MKRCPNCNLGYTDESLEFCLEDGTRLEIFNEATDEPPTVYSKSGAYTTTQTKTAQTSPNINNFGTWAETPNSQMNMQAQGENLPQTDTPPQSETDSFTTKFFGFAPIIVALAQNYWQWLYMTQYNSFKFPDFLWELNFYVWLILLVGGVLLGVTALRKNVNKSFAVVSLVILAVNFLLCIVPRR